MSDVFFYKMVVNPATFESMVREEDIKARFKENLAIELAHQLIKGNRIKFTYNRNNLNDDVILKAEVRL